MLFNTIFDPRVGKMFEKYVDSKAQSRHTLFQCSVRIFVTKSVVHKIHIVTCLVSISAMPHFWNSGYRKIRPSHPETFGKSDEARIFPVQNPI